MSSPEPEPELVAMARQARAMAYAPYSCFAVGAAVRTASGSVFTGCNVENASYGLSICAERVAVFRAVCEGERQFEALAVVSENMAAPCGACRQVLSEFGLTTKVILADLEGQCKVFTVGELLPEAFTPASL
ncbi:MAG: cytidine deaminase, partial [Anaerolineae bacterium]|nr:cytidine deaminase [Anaerolineae bacterium]